jgi:hypothetical protein
MRMRGFFEQNISGLGSSDRSLCLFNTLRQPGADYIAPDDLRPVLEDLVLEHHGLQEVRQPAIQSLYVDMILVRIFHFVGTKRSMRISYSDLCKSNLANALFDIQDVDPETIDFFSTKVFLRLFQAWDKGRNDSGVVAINCITSLLRRFKIVLPAHRLPAVVAELRAIKVGNLMVANPSGHITFAQYVECYLHCKSIMCGYDNSVNFWLHCMDSDADGFLGQHDVIEQFEHKVFILQKNKQHTHQAQHDGATAWRILCDSVRPRYSDKISAHDIKATRAQSIVRDMLLSIGPTKINCNFLPCPEAGKRCAQPHTA